MTTTETIIQIEDLTKIFYTDEIETQHGQSSRASIAGSMWRCRGLRDAESHAAVDHRVVGYPNAGRYT
jgi:hypothetical protein